MFDFPESSETRISVWVTSSARHRDSRRTTVRRLREARGGAQPLGHGWRSPVESIAASDDMASGGTQDQPLMTPAYRSPPVAARDVDGIKNRTRVRRHGRAPAAQGRFSAARI